MLPTQLHVALWFEKRDKRGLAAPFSAASALGQSHGGVFEKKSPQIRLQTVDISGIHSYTWVLHSYKHKTNPK